MIAIATLLLVVTISLLVTRVATVILTASESERVVDNPLRRRVIMTLMLLGIAGIVASASSMILGFRSGGIGHQGWRLLELGCGLLALVYVSRSRWVDRRLHELALRDEGAAVLGVTQRSGRYLGAPTGDTLLRAGDILVIYGRGELLRELDDRPFGPDGDLAHAAAVARQNRIEQEQSETEKSRGAA